MDATLARGIARRVCRETAGLLEAVEDIVNRPRSGTNTAWARSVARDLRRAAGPALAVAQAGSKVRYIGLLLPVTTDYVPLTRVTRATKLGGLGLAILQIDQRRRDTTMIMPRCRYSQHALLRLIQRADLSSPREILAHVAPPLKRLFIGIEHFEHIPVDMEVRLNTDDGLLICLREPAGMVVVTAIPERSMCDGKRKSWQSTRALLEDMGGAA